MKIATFSTLALLMFSFSSFAAGPRLLSSTSYDFDKDGKMDQVQLLDISTDQDDTKMSLVITMGNGNQIVNDVVIYKSGLRDGVGVTMKVLANGSIFLRQTKDWGTSMFSASLYIAFRNSEFKVAGLDYEWLYREKGGSCESNYLTGQGTINKKPVSFNKRDIEFTSSFSPSALIGECVDKTN